MPIVSHPVAEMSPREEVAYEIGSMIDEANDSPEDINPYALADEILEYVEARINSVDDDGKVIFRVG